MDQTGMKSSDQHVRNADIMLDIFAHWFNAWLHYIYF